jgi:D-alanyl-D-alanine carboxypeptidase
MNQPHRSSSAASLVVIASMIAGCAAPQAHVAATTQAGAKADGEVGLATRALVALNSHDVPQAIDFAERAVARTPNEASLRALLGSAYFAGGRFRSAAAAFNDSLSLNSNQPQVVLKLALVQIALGKNDQAIDFLNASRGVLDASDYGLALTLAGRPAEAIAVLEPAARDRGADATVRQNLALAYAFAGDWTNARTIASQDVPGNQLDARIHQWMQLAKPSHASDQVAALVGVTPAAVDPGQPVNLALNNTETRVAQAVPVSAPQTAVQAVAASAPALKPVVVVEAVAPAPPPLRATKVAAPAPGLKPVVLVEAIAPAAPPQRATSLASLAATAVSDVKAVFASVLPHNPAPAAKPRRVVVAVQRPTVRRGNSPAVVQLGAYGSPNRVLTAWNGAARKYGALKAYLPMSARFASPKGVFYRLSVQGFASDHDARLTCESLRRQGGSCFVRNVAGDTPVQYASR